MSPIACTPHSVMVEAQETHRESIREVRRGMHCHFGYTFILATIFFLGEEMLYGQEHSALLAMHTIWT